MLNKHPILILLFVMLTSLAFAVTTVDDATYKVTDANDVVVADSIAKAGDTVEFTVDIDTDVNVTQVRIFTTDLVDLTNAEPLVLTAQATNEIYKGSYVVTSGNVNNSAPGIDYTIEVYYAGGATPVEQVEKLKINNRVIPVITDTLSTWIDYTDSATKDVVGIGNTITFKLRRSWNPSTVDVDSLFLDLSSLGGGNNVEATRSGTDFSYSMTILAGSVAGDYPPEVVIPIRMINIHGVESESGNVISGKSNGVPVAVDTAYPTIPNGANPEAYDDQYRFSPGSVVVTGWDTDHDDIKGKITIPNFGTPGNINTIYFQVQNENTDYVYPNLLKYSHGDADVDVTTEPGSVIFTWDGTIPGATLTNGIYGFSVKRIADAAGNSVNYAPQPEVANPLFTQGHSLLNAVDWVLDNVAPEFKKLGNIDSPLQVLKSVDDEAPANNTIVRSILESSDDTDPGEISDSDNFGGIDELYFTFDVKRDFTNDTEENRREFVKYWVEVSGGTTKKYFYPGSGELGGDLASLVRTDVFDYPADQTFAFKEVNSKTSFTWEASDWDIYPAGVYTVTAYIQDNAGNIRTSEKTITIVDQFTYAGPNVTAANINSYNIDSSHIGGFDPTYVNAETWKQFYVTSTYQSGSMLNDIYFDSSTNNNEIKIKVRVNHKDQAEKVEFTKHDDALPDAFNATIMSADFEAIPGSPNSGFAVLTVPMSAFDEDDFLLANKEFTFGQLGTNLDIKVWTRTIADGTTPNPYNIQSYAVGTRKFKINRPLEPEWPAIASNVVANPFCLSPGNPSYSYDSVTNPAVDGVGSSNEIEFQIGMSNRNYGWTLKVYDPASPDDEDSFIETGTYIANAAAIDESITFYNLTNAFQPIVSPTGTEVLTIDLSVRPAPFTDSGYNTIADLTSSSTMKVDNQNPKFVDLNGDSALDTNGYLPYPEASNDNSYFITNNNNTFVVPVVMSEPLVEAGWDGVVYNEDTNAVLFPSTEVTIVATGKVDATHPRVECPTNLGTWAYSLFDLQVTITGLPNAAINNTLVIIAPADFAGNPDRVNNPTFPYGADAWYNDSSEAYVHFIQMVEEITIVDTKFYHKNSANVDIADRAKASGNFKFTVEVSSYDNIQPAYDSTLRGVNNTLFDVDFTGTNGFASVNLNPAIPTVTQKANDNWLITYTGSYVAKANTVQSSHLDIDGTVAFVFATDDDNAIHSIDFNHSDVIYDNQAPVMTISSVTNNANEGTNYTLKCNITDADTGVWNDKVRLSSPELNLTNVAYNSVAAGVYTWTVAIPANFTTNTINFNVVAKDNIDNERTVNSKVDVLAIPTVSNVVVENVQGATQHADHGNHQYIIENNNKVLVKFNLTQTERIDGVTIALGNGKSINLNAAYVASNFIDGLNTYTFTDFGTGTQDATLRATVTINHPYDHNIVSSNDISLPASVVPFVDNNQVDITGLRVFVDGTETTNYLNLDLSIPFEIKANVIAYDNDIDNHLDLSDVKLSFTAAGNTVQVAGLPSRTKGALAQTVKAGYVKYNYTYTWTNANFVYADFQNTDLTNDGYDVYTFLVNARSNYNFVAVPYSETVTAFDIPAYTFNGITPTRWSGTDPDGWFAPEHDLELTMKVVSVLADINAIAEFDNITNNFPDVVWVPGTVNPTSAIVDGNTIYTHVVTWSENPDIQACWNTYADGDIIPVEVRYNDFFIPTPISVVKTIKIDLDVPAYAEYSMVQDVSTINTYATANAIVGINTLANHVGAHNFDLTLNDPDDLNSYQFDGSLFVKRIVEDKNGVSVKESDVAIPTISANWTVGLLGSEVVSPTKRAFIWKLTPINNTLVNHTDIVSVQFNQVEDLVGHKNYAGEDYNSPSPRYLAEGPITSIVFIASQADVDAITAFQYDGSDRMNADSAPYISTGGKIGLILEVEPNPNDNASVAQVEILADPYNGAIDDWVTLTANVNVDDEYYLNSDIDVNSTSLGWLPLTYKITYTTGEVRIHTQANVYNLIDITSTSLDEISVWSETLGQSGMYYVTPGDEATIRVVFNSDAPETNTVQKPYVTLSGLSNILDMASPYTVPQANISWDGTQWVAEVTGVLVLANHNTTSQTVSVTATNVTGQTTDVSTKIVSYAGSGPIVPLIEYVELITDTATNYLALSGNQVVNPVVNVYIDTQYQEFIDNVTIDPIAGLTFGAYTVVPTAAHNSLWMVTFPVTISNPALFAEGQIVTLDITSYRDPFDNITTDVFEHEVSLDVEVDGNDFDVVLNNPGIQNPTMGDFVFTLDFSNFGETFTPAHVPALTDFVISSTELVNDLNPTLIAVDVASLTIDATDFTVAAALLGNTDFTVTYTNIYGFEKTETINILLDASAPVVATNGIIFESPVGMTSYSWGDAVSYDQDWSSLKVELEDPTMFGTAGVGIANATIDIALGTVTPSTDAFTNLDPAFNGTNVEYTFNGNYSGFDLAEGNYIVTVEAWDNLNNYYTSTQEFVYAHAPAGVSAITDPAITLNSGMDIELEFLVNDPTGVVNNVEFQVYYDANNDGDYTDDLGNLFIQANDSVYPYGFDWDLSSPFYTSYQYNANYDLNIDGDNLDADENIRNYIVRVLTTSSQMRSVSDTQFTYSVADVTAPEVSDVIVDVLAVTPIVYDYVTPANNNIDLTALVGTWTDVDYVELTVNGDLLTYDLITPVNWVYDATDIGAVTITAMAYDFVGNVSAVADFSTVLEIVNPSYNKSYDLALFDYTNFNSDMPIANATVYSPSNPLIQNNVRLYTVYPFGLEGISEIQFFVNRIETATGNVVATLPVNNDATVNPQYGNNNVVLPMNCYDATLDIWNSWITVDPNLYTDNGNYDGTDYTYEFFATMIDQYTGIEVIPQVGTVNNNTSFRVDYLKPLLVVNNASVTHTSYAYHDANADRLVFDYTDNDAIPTNNFVVEYNGVDVTNNVDDTTPNLVAISFNGLNEIEGEGVVTYDVTVTDANGNVSDVTPMDVYVDNQAPQTEIATLAYATDADNGGEAMNQLHAYDGNPIFVMAGATENLSIQIDRAQILGLSSENTDTWANRTQPWYDNANDDIYPPVKLYRNINGNGWNLIAFDHEVDANNMYQFDITVNNGAIVEFAVIAEDTRGNIEGDVVLRDALTNAVLRPLNGNIIADGEIDNAVNLTVNVLYPTDITTTIVNHNADDVISGLALLTANVATPANVASVEFQYNDGMNWIAIGTDDSMLDVDYLFSIDSANIPYAVIPGVHVEIIDSANASTMVELDGAMDNWSKTVTLLRDTYTVNYYVDANNDGVIGAVERVNYFITQDMINADGFSYQFDTTTIVDGSYLFRAVPFDNLVATDDEASAVEMNLIIDNTAPAYDLTALNTVVIDSYNVLDENVEFTLAYGNVNDVHMVRAWLINMTNPLDNYRIVFETYEAYDVRTTDFSLVLNNVPDGNYYLKLNVEDFNNNTNIQTPALGDNLHLDTNTPVITAVNNALNMSGIYTETHQFTVTYNDYLALLLDANGAELGVKAFAATFTHNAIVDVVDVKVSDDGTQLVFNWDPSQAMMNEVLVNGQDNILVNLDVNVTDHNDYVSADFNVGNFTLTSGEVGARIMVVSDFRNGLETYHQTSVTNNTEITDVIGGNNLNMFAFLPEGNNVIVPNNVRFEYWDGLNWIQFAANAVWTPIANFAGTGTISGYAQYMTINWNIANMDGDYTVRTVSDYNFGEIANETNLHIWNSTIVPEIVVSTADGMVTTEVNRGSEYIVSLGNIVSTHPEFLNQVNYMYRFLDENDQIASPWNQLSGFTADDYDWTIGMDYLFAEKVQLAVQVENIFNNVADQVSFIANNGAYYVVDIVDSEAPVVTALDVTQAGNAVAPDATVAIANALDIAVTVDNPVLDLSSIAIALDGVEVNAVTYNTNNQVNPTMVNYSLDISALITGTYQIEVTTTDFVGHTYTEVFGFNIDTDAPTGALVLEENDNGYIERGLDYTFNANGMDNVTAVEDLMINYFWLSDVANDVWTPIVLDADGQWMIPNNWVMNVSYEFKAVITDEYNNSAETMVSYQVRDNVTPIVINNVNTLVGFNNVHFNGPVEIELAVGADVDELNTWMKAPTATDWTAGATLPVVNGLATYTFTPADTDLDGVYTFGFGPVVRFVDVQVEAEVIIDRAVTPANPMVAGITDDSIFNLNDEITLTFDVAVDEVLDTNIELLYADILNNTWVSLGTTVAVVDAITNNAEVTFANLGLVEGFYNFKAMVRDLAVPFNETELALANNVYFDASAPEVFFTNIDDNSEFVLGNLVSVNADVNYTDGTNNIAPLDVASVEFLINNVSVAVVETAPYTYVWNTALLANVGTYTFEAIVTDNDGFVNNVLQNVVVVTPDENDPYAVITGFEFNNEAISSDKMYAVVNHWGNNVISVVAQYTTNNIDWVDFAINTTNNDPRYDFDFNAEAIQNAAAIKVLVNMNNGEETSLVYPINVTYNAGEFELVAANGSIEIHENNNLVIVDTDSMPYVIRVDENGYAGYEDINADNEFNLVVNANNELPGYWLSGVANNNAWLSFVELDAMAASNGVTVNYNNPYWFVMLDNEMPLADHYAQLTDQVLVQSNIAGNAVYTLPMTGTMAVEGNVVALAWDALLGDFVEIDVEYDETNATMTFTAPVNTVVTVGQYVGFEMFVTEFAPVNDDVYMNAGALWTLPNVAMDFTVYHEETVMGYQLPAGFGLGNISITLNDGVNNVNNIALVNGVVSFDLVNMNAGLNELMVNVEMNGFQANQILTFNVDNTLPTIEFDSTVQLSATNRTLTATMEDAETGLVDYDLVITNNNLPIPVVITVPMNEITVAGNAYSYAMTIEELVTLVPVRNRTVATLNVQWTAVNNLNQINVMNANVTANVVVNRPIITIQNDGFENGWWLNPAMANNILMTVVPADNRTIALEDINVSIFAVTTANPAGILVQTSNPVPTGNADEYTFGFAQLQLPSSLGLLVRVNATDDIDVNNVAEQTFSLDYMDPVVTATAPTNLVVNYGNDAQIAFSFTDPQGQYTEVVNGVIIQHYSGASGIDVSTLVLTVDGDVETGEINNGSIAYNAPGLLPGSHTAVVSVSDFVGNTGSATVNFEVVGGPAPEVTFEPLANGTWWITTAHSYELEVNLSSGHNDSQLQSVVANIIELPNNEVIQGPFAVSFQNGVGTINFHGGIVTPGQNAIKIEVVAENDWAIQTISSQTYPIDNSRPELTIVNPMADYNVMVGNSVNVNITAMDNMSGLEMSSIKVTSLNGDFVIEATDDVTPESFNLVVNPDMAGTYVIEAQATDMAGNVTTVTRNFAINAPAPIIVISDLEDSNGWVNTQNNNNISFTVDGNGYNLDSSSIMASVIAVPSMEEIYEPFAINSVDGNYVVSVHGGVIPADANSIKIIVTASNVAGGHAVANHSYPIDSYNPTIEFVSPVASAAYTQAENMFVDVMMELSDIMPAVETMASSGLDRLEMRVFDNANVVVLDTVKTNIANSYNCRVPVNGIGQYRIEATIYDRAGNSTNKMMNFTVEIDYSAINLEFTAKPYMYPSPLTRGDAGTFVIPTSKEAQVTIEIFDFAGKLVRNMNYNAIGGTTNNTIQFDGRTNDGKRLPRGAYFARINIVDGAKELNKVVKIAIQ